MAELFIASDNVIPDIKEFIDKLTNPKDTLSVFIGMEICNDRFEIDRYHYTVLCKRLTLFPNLEPGAYTSFFRGMKDKLKLAVQYAYNFYIYLVSSEIPNTFLKTMILHSGYAMGEEVFNSYCMSAVTMLSEHIQTITELNETYTDVFYKQMDKVPTIKASLGELLSISAESLEFHEDKRYNHCLEFYAPASPIYKFHPYFMDGIETFAIYLIDRPENVSTVRFTVICSERYIQFGLSEHNGKLIFTSDEGKSLQESISTIIGSSLDENSRDIVKRVHLCISGVLKETCYTFLEFTSDVEKATNEIIGEICRITEIFSKCINRVISANSIFDFKSHSSELRDATQRGKIRTPILSVNVYAHRDNSIKEQRCTYEIPMEGIPTSLVDIMSRAFLSATRIIPIEDDFYKDGSYVELSVSIWDLDSIDICKLNIEDAATAIDVRYELTKRGIVHSIIGNYKEVVNKNDTDNTDITSDFVL